MKLKGCPQLKCPACGGRIGNATDRKILNGTSVSVVDETNLKEYEYVFQCKCCGKTVGIKNKSVVRIPLIKKSAV